MDHAKIDGSEDSTRSEAVMAMAQDVRTLDFAGDPNNGHVADNEPMANRGNDVLGPAQSDAVSKLAHDVRPLESPPE